MSENLAEDNLCGGALVHLVSRGNAIVAELLRLKDYIPNVFRLEKKQDQLKYGDIICDFLYFKMSDEFENKIEKSPHLQELDTELRNNNMEILNRFFLAFESIHRYVNDINQFMDDLEDGIYIQQTLEGLLSNLEGKQLLCEMLYLYGVMLLEVDIHIDGLVRERLLVSYYRYSAQRYTGTTTVDDVCKLMRSTGLTTSKRPSDYPVDYFKRVPINEELVNMVIARLRTEDIYNQISAYPNPEHRSIALSTQAAMLFVCLYFDASILYQQTAKMREIVDKYFPDNWVINIYMGLTINLVDAWDSFRAAKLALGNTLEAENINYQCNFHSNKLKKCLKQTQQWLKKGALTEEKVFDNVNKIVAIFRDCNVTLRWLIMHTASHYSVPEVNKRSKQIREQIISSLQYNERSTFELLLNTAELELNFKELSKQLLREKENRWNQWKKESMDIMHELSDAFSGEKPLTRLTKNEKLQIWFKEVANQIELLNIEKVKSSSKKLVQLMQALDEVQGFHQLSSHHQVNEYLKEANTLMLRMVRSFSLKEGILIDLQIIGDLSYAWNLIEMFTNLMQEGIKKDPSLASKLRAAFLKLSSALETPLLRINQAGSDDLVSVSEYYSQELVRYISRVLHIIPETIFQLMTEIIKLQTVNIKEVPTRLDKDKLKDYAHFEERMEVARLTYVVSVLSEGILKMKSTLVGIVRIDPKKLLEDGIRRELINHVSSALHSSMFFNPKLKVSELSVKLSQLSETMDGYRRSFEYVQDYIDIYGLKIWQEELSRIIGYNVELECNSFLKHKMNPKQSSFQNDLIPIPVFPQLDSQSVTFIGRILREFIRITDPKTTVYVPNTSSWFDFKSQIEVVNSKIFSEIKNSIGISGLTGLDKLICFMIATKLQAFLSCLEKEVLKESLWSDLLCNLSAAISPTIKLIENPQKVYGSYLGKLHKLPANLLEIILKIGQLQILRKQIFYELQISCKSDSKRMYNDLDAFNQILLSDIKAHYRDPTSRAHPKKENKLLAEFSDYLDWAGIGNPYAKIYITTPSIPNLPLFLFTFVAFQLMKLQWQKNIGTLVWKKCGDSLDGTPLIVGIQTLFRQFHPNIRNQFIAYFAQYLLSHVTIVANNANNKIDIPAEIQSSIQFLQNFIYYSGLSQEMLIEHIPESVFHIIDMIAP